MSGLKKKPIIGIIGGIGSGKSTVAAQFGRLGCAVIDADKIAHKIIEQENIKQKIVERFGNSILDKSGMINRSKLAQAAFANPEKYQQLNAIVHPPVIEYVEQLISQYENESKLKAIVLDVPLLVEIGWQKRCNRLIFVECRKNLRVARAQKNGILNEKQLEIRENFQISLDNKKKLSDNVVDNCMDQAAMARQVILIFSDVMKNG